MKKEKTYCDHCGDPIPKGKGFPITHLPCNISSANKGESGILCKKCMVELEICHVCLSFKNDGDDPEDNESPENGCEKCGLLFHESCDQGFHTQQYSHICSKCAGKMGLIE